MHVLDRMPGVAFIPAPVGVFGDGPTTRFSVRSSGSILASAAIAAPAQPANNRAVREALERAGVEFIDENGGGAGVQLRKPRRGQTEKGSNRIAGEAVDGRSSTIEDRLIFL